MLRCERDLLVESHFLSERVFLLDYVSTVFQGSNRPLRQIGYGKLLLTKHNDIKKINKENSHFSSQFF